MARQSWTEDGAAHHIDFVYDQQGKPLTLRYQAGDAYYTYYCLTNLQGDVIKLYLVDLVNGKLTVTEAASYTYDAWGNVTDINRTAADTQDIAHLNPIRYRGYYQDVETGFYYLQSRYYDPAIGRFVNADSLAVTGTGFLGYNMFAYCNNNPLKYLDPSGKILVISYTKLMECRKSGTSIFDNARDVSFTTDYKNSNCYGYALGKKEAVSPGFANGRSSYSQPLTIDVLKSNIELDLTLLGTNHSEVNANYKKRAMNV